MPRFVAPLLALTVLLSGCGSDPAPPESITVTFVRHAQSQANADGVIDTTVPGPGITGEGEQQAQQVADELRGKDFDGIYASSMIRTQQTAAPLARELGEQVDVLPGLKEIPAGWFEGSPQDAAAMTYFLAPELWLQGQRSARIPGAIDGNEFIDEFTGAMQRIYDSGDKNVVAFSHGAAIAVWTQLTVSNTDANLLMSHPLPNVGQVVIEGNPVTGWQLVSWDGLSG